jgi:hypothetical protein
MPTVHLQPGTLFTPVTRSVTRSILDFATHLGFTPDPAQAHLLSTKAQRVIVNCARQWGKSTVTALRAAYHALHNPGTLTLVAAPSWRQSTEFLRKVRSFLSRLTFRLRGDGANRHSLLLPNQSRIIAIPSSEATTRGFSGVSLLIIDEAARASEDLFDALRPSLATTDGDIWLLSTPNGKRGFFFKIWHAGGAAWERHMVKAQDNPRISKAFLEREKQLIDEEKFLEEYGCEFVQGAAYLFSLDVLEKAVSDKYHAWIDGKPK